MGSFSLMHWLIVIVVILLLFGRGRLSQVMGDFAKGIKAFKTEMKDDSKDDQQKINKD
ncbi:MAG: twin-arginine translocase TatA/TatE family subunit [Alphaproteobacteria bacterium]|nr:MAG: twin-arginine translocase TatA/TatE family subunit [Alphaproteobacteria bacterium]